MAIPRNLANLANQLNGDGDVPKIEVGDSKVQVTDTGSDGAITFTTDNAVRAILDNSNILYVSNGITSATPSDFEIRSTSGVGTDISGSDLSIRAGSNTGNAVGGDMYLYVGRTSSSSSTTNRGYYQALYLTDGLGLGTVGGTKYASFFGGTTPFDGFSTYSNRTTVVGISAIGSGADAQGIIEMRGGSNTNGGIQNQIVFYGTSSSGLQARIFSASQGTSSTSGQIIMSVQSSGTEYTGFYITGTGQPYFPNHDTTASAANAVLNSSTGILQRSTSSLRYKTDVEDLWTENADSILSMRPVWYRSLCEGDNNGWSWYGLIAEEVAEIEPRLVHWTYLPDAYEKVTKNTVDEDGNEVLDDDGNVMPYTEKVLKADAEMVPDGVQYDRLTVLLLDVVKRQNQRIEALEAKVAALENQP